MALRETELESEFEIEGELESEIEGEEEGEEFLSGIVRGLLGEGEFEEEIEGEEEGEEFLSGIVRGLLGEGEGEYEDESEEFFGRIAAFVRRAAPVLRQVARVAAPMVGTAFGGPLGGALGSMAARALGEGEYELEDELEDEAEDEAEEELEAESAQAMTESEALAEMMAAVAAQARSEAEAEAMIGAATVTVLSPRDRAAIRRLLPHMVRAVCVLTRLLRQRRLTRPAVRAVPVIVQRSGRVLARRAAAGRPVNRRVAARVMSRQVRSVLGSPRQTTAALRRNVRASSAIRRGYGSMGRSYARRPGRTGFGSAVPTATADAHWPERTPTS